MPQPSYYDDGTNNSPGESLRSVTLIAVTVALAFVCSYLTFPVNLPLGGKISLEAVPILVLALMRGFRAGITAGVLDGFLHFVNEPIVVHPLSFLLEYPVAHASVALAALFNWNAERPTALRCVGGLTLGLGTCFLIHVVCGVLLFAEGRVGGEAWMYSISYNGYYMLGNWVLAMATVPWLVPNLYDQDAA